MLTSKETCTPEMHFIQIRIMTITSGIIPFIFCPTFAFARNTSISAIAVTASLISALFCDIVWHISNNILFSSALIIPEKSMILELIKRLIVGNVDQIAVFVG